jgi:hypothetical protein
MTYIVDLTLVTQNLFWIYGVLGMNQDNITRRMIKLAFILHINSNERNRLLVDIEAYSKTAKTYSHDGADTTFDKIESLITSSLIKYEEVFERDRHRLLGRLQDQREENWVVRPDTSDSTAD